MTVSKNNVIDPISVMVYSYDWTHYVALTSLCQSIQSGCVISDACDGDEFLNKAAASQPALIILDLSPRNSVALILTLRRQCPNTVFVVTQAAFLFSDAMVAEYFKGMVLKRYDALLEMPPSLLFAEYQHLACVLREEKSPTVLFQRYHQGLSAVLLAIKQLMYSRFSQMMASPRGQEVVLGWLVKGIDPITVGRRLGCSSKVIYHYRLMAMKVLGIQNRTRDFIASLEVTSGPTSAYLSPKLSGGNAYPVKAVSTRDRVEWARLYPLLPAKEASVS